MAVDPKVVGGGAAIVAIGGGSGYAISQATSSSETASTKTIGGQIGTEWLLNTSDNSNDQEFKELAEKLKTHVSDPTLDDELTAIKGKAETEIWEALKKWCEKTYKATYEEDSKLWKLANKFCKKPTISDKLEGTKLDTTTSTDSDNLWKNKAESSKTKSKNKDLKDKISSATNTDTAKFSALKEWCKEQYSKVYDNKFTNEEEKKEYTFLSEVKKWCVILIEDKLESTKKTPLDNDSGGTEWKKLINSLHTHTKTGSGDDNFDLPEDLNTVKTSINNSQDKWAELKTWCNSKYELPFKTEDATFKSVKKFCQKKNN